MKKMTTLPLILALGLFGTQALASSNDLQSQSAIQQQYSQYVEQGKSIKDAFHALQLEIAYETAAMQSATPCKKMVRGL